MTRGWGGLENEKGVRKAILLGQKSVRGEQRLARGPVSGCEKKTSSMLVKDILLAKSSYLAKETKHAEMKDTSGRQAARKEDDNTFWSTYVEALKSLESQFAMVVDNRELTVG